MLLGNHGLMTRCPKVFEAWIEQNTKDEAAERTHMQVCEMEARERLLSHDMSRLQVILLQTAICAAVETFQ
jgi:hypothetical protein